VKVCVGIACSAQPAAAWLEHIADAPHPDSAARAMSGFFAAFRSCSRDPCAAWRGRWRVSWRNRSPGRRSCAAC